MGNQTQWERGTQRYETLLERAGAMGNQTQWESGTQGYETQLERAGAMGNQTQWERGTLGYETQHDNWKEQDLCLTKLNEKGELKVMKLNWEEDI